jgi:hypothetical protein
MIFDSFVFRENDSFYIDLNESLEFDVCEGDLIKFSFEKKNYLAKVIEGKYRHDKIFDLEIIKKIDSV